jgi:hypothetical protein
LSITKTEGGTDDVTNVASVSVTNAGVTITLPLATFTYSSPVFAIGKASASSSTDSSSTASSSSSSDSSSSAEADSSGASDAPVSTTLTPTASTSVAGGAGSLSIAPSGASPSATLSWNEGAFGSAPVTVTTSIATLASQLFAAGTVVVDLSVRSADGSPVTSFAAPLELGFPNAPANVQPEYSTDGHTWTTIPLLTGTTLPAGERDGWYRDGAGLLHVLTRHATYYGLAQQLDLKYGIKRTLHLRKQATLVLYASPTLDSVVKVTLMRGKTAVGSWSRLVGHGNTLPLQLGLPLGARAGGAYKLAIAVTADDQQRLLRSLQLRFVR